LITHSTPAKEVHTKAKYLIYYPGIIITTKIYLYQTETLSIESNYDFALIIKIGITLLHIQSLSSCYKYSSFSSLIS
jgi:hypothetical protein